MGKKIKARISEDVSDSLRCEALGGHPIDVGGTKACLFVTDDHGTPIRDVDVDVLASLKREIMEKKGPVEKVI